MAVHRDGEVVGRDDGHNSAVIRVATIEEMERYGFVQEDALSVAWVAEQDGAVVGRCAATFDKGTVFCHGMRVESDDKYLALKLWRHVRAALKRFGFDEVFLHIGKLEDDKVRRMWERIGFERVLTVYRGDI